MKIMVFLHGTAIMHKSASGCPRDERVKQVVEREASILDFANYVPVENAVKKLQTWHAQGAEILYLSSHKKIEEVEKDRTVLSNYHFPKGQIYFRQHDELFEDIVERIIPKILVEDDCESIGGEKEMVYPRLNPEVVTRIKSIVVREFEGLDHLPDDLFELINY